MPFARRSSKTRSLRPTTPPSASSAPLACTRALAPPLTSGFLRAPRSRCTSTPCSRKKFRRLPPLLPPPQRQPCSASPNHGRRGCADVRIVDGKHFVSRAKSRHAAAVSQRLYIIRGVYVSARVMVGYTTSERCGSPLYTCQWQHEVSIPSIDS
jgi:hypothetical protein